MKKLLLPFLAAALLLSCQSEIKRDQYPIEIIGDWATKRDTTDQNEKVLTFSFSEDTCSYLMPFKNFTPYYISSDTLFVGKKHNDRTLDEMRSLQPSFFAFKIVSFQKNTLSLASIDQLPNRTQRLIDRYGSETIQLQRILPKSKESFERIGLQVTHCYGPCPVIYLELDKEGNVYFKRVVNPKEWALAGRISERRLNIIRNKIQNVSWPDVESNYTAPWTDDQTNAIILTTADKQYRSRVYGKYAEPIALRMLIHELSEITQFMGAQLDTIDIDQLHFNEELYGMLK
ncbi:MAG: DUF6438 domain-containing protein [Bacteroidota bacterium]